ncbi:MAG TPA: type IV toxin-antitoxin system AbiEi family antitoxin domain-containing protein [Solirubrobacteraceae bacterium]|nr:type IV toxin-antitoxin system AbiEi family antitoxin domain-containing protein [Solirubrobacteraceae bacterium]
MGADRVIAALAARQHGAVARAQLLEAGVSSEAIKHRTDNRRLTPLHRGVYRLGETETRLTRLMAAVLAAGPTAALSHHAAAELHGFGPERKGPIDVTVTKGHARKRAGLRIHRARTLDRQLIHGIPATTPARTLLDLAATLPQRDLHRAIEEAQVQRKLDPSSLAEAVDQARGHRGAGALRAAAMTSTHEPALTRSEAERVLLDLIRRAELPPPRTNQRIGRWEVDALWPDHRLVVEVDGFAYHATREAFERDRRKQAELTAAGYRVNRITWLQLSREREWVAAKLSGALSAAS